MANSRRPPSALFDMSFDSPLVPRSDRLVGLVVTIVSLIIAVVGGGGTLASAIDSQHLAQRTRLQELEHTDRLRMSERDHADKRPRMDQLRACYIRLNGHDRNYRDALLA